MRKNNAELFFDITKELLSAGADRASVIDARLIKTNSTFRDICASNACGMYGKCYTCPPDVGEIDELREKIKRYDHALVYQKVFKLEDSFDFEGMTEAKRRFYPLQSIARKAFSKIGIENALYLGAGACGACVTCAKVTGEPCRHPEIASSSLEAYGIDVAHLATAAGMKYINGENTVTYFGAVLFSF
ncbi:MAG: DUF2284 domain-containing protein [Clostridia bacterium]|nr:DUF2284 domain-containing protein [Clostridia bacterium]